MIRIIPSPVRSSSVVVIEYPLHTLEVSVEHLVELNLSLGLFDIKLELLLIVVPLSLVSIFLVGLDEVLHESMVALNGFCSLLLHKINLCIHI